MSATPVFILGITRRSGTNFLYRALLLHPDCGAARQPGEDFLVHEADRLVGYVDAVAAHWNRDWDANGLRSTDLRRALGGAWLTHLMPRDPRPFVVTKTPSVRGLEHVPRLLPEARVLVVVRDGRDVAESGVRSLDWTYEAAFRTWAAGAEKVVERLGCDPPDFELIRFESLVREPEGEIRKALRHCGMNPETYDYDALRNLPVYGSSTARGGEDSVHWKPVERPEAFDPVGRWAGWDDALARRYARVCGPVAAKLGYEASGASSGWLGRIAASLRAAFGRR